MLWPKRVKHLQYLDIPVLRIAAIGLALDIVPPHVLLPARECPRRFAGAGAGLAADAAVDVEDGGKLPIRVRLGVGVGHRAAKMPVVDVGHSLSPCW